MIIKLYRYGFWAIRVSLWIYTVIILPPLILIQTLSLLRQGPPILSALPSLPALIASGMLVPAVGGIMLWIAGDLTVGELWHSTRRVLMVHLGTSIIVVWLLNWILRPTLTVSYPLLAILYGLVATIVPIAVYFVASYDLHDMNTTDDRDSIMRSLAKTVAALLIFTAVSSGLYGVTAQGSVMIRYIGDAQLYESLGSHITHWEPSLVYRSTKVIIQGRGFDWKENKRVRLMTQYGPLDTTLWTDTKIIVTIPLSVPVGPLQMWVEKPVLWKGSVSKTKSNVVSVRVLPVTGSFTPEDDAYFRQLKSLQPETLKINGYH